MSKRDRINQINVNNLVDHEHVVINNYDESGEIEEVGYLYRTRNGALRFCWRLQEEWDVYGLSYKRIFRLDNFVGAQLIGHVVNQFFSDLNLEEGINYSLKTCKQGKWQQCGELMRVGDSCVFTFVKKPLKYDIYAYPENRVHQITRELSL